MVLKNNNIVIIKADAIQTLCTTAMEYPFVLLKVPQLNRLQPVPSHIKTAAINHPSNRA